MSKTVIQLRRVGNPATCHGVKDTFRLLKDKTIIGRNSITADFYINSSLHPKLISREHAVITQTKTEKGIIEFTIQDKSINGTFVNDTKIQGTICLSVGDTVTFGHLQGIKVKPWEKAKQPNSEFRFQLEEATDQPVSSSSGRQPLSSYDNNLNCPNQNQTQTLIENGSSSKEPSSSSIQSSSVTLTQTAKSGSVKEAVRKIEGRPGESKSKELNRQEKGNVSILESTKKCLPLNKCIIGQITSALDTKESTEVGCISKENIQQQKDNGSPSTPENSSGMEKGATDCKPVDSSQAKDLDNDATTPSLNVPALTPTSILPKQLILGVPACRVKSAVKKDTLPAERKFDFPFLSLVEGSRDSREEEAPDDDTTVESDEDIFAITSEVKSKVERLMEEEDEDSFSPKFPSFSNDDDVVSKPMEAPGMSDRVNTRLQISRRKSAPLNEGKSVLSKVLPDDEVNARKRKSDGALPSAKRTTAELEICSAVKCLRPTGIMIPWVQCDDCDEWFHTSCARCNFEVVRKASAAFHCGCI